MFDQPSGKWLNRAVVYVYIACSIVLLLLRNHRVIDIFRIRVQKPFRHILLHLRQDFFFLLSSVLPSRHIDEILMYETGADSNDYMPLFVCKAEIISSMWTFKDSRCLRHILVHMNSSIGDATGYKLEGIPSAWAGECSHKLNLSAF